MKSIKVPPVWLKPFDFDMHGMSKLRHRKRRAFPGNIAKCFIRRDFPLNRHWLIRHSAPIKWIRGEPCPDHNAIRRGITGSDSQRKRIAVELRPS